MGRKSNSFVKDKNPFENMNYAVKVGQNSPKLTPDSIKESSFSELKDRRKE